MRRSPVALGAAAIAIALAVAVADQATAFRYSVPVQAKSPWPEMRRDSRNTGSSPIRGVYRGDRPWSFATARGIFSTPVDRRERDGLRRVGGPVVLRPRPRRARRLAIPHRRDHRQRGRPGQPSQEGPESHDHLRIRGRAALPPAHHGAPAPQAEDRLGLRADPAAGRGPAGELVGGEPGDRSGRDHLRRQHRRRRVRDQSRRHPALGDRARPVGVDDARLRRGERVGQHLLGLGRPLRLLTRPERRPALADVHPRLRHLFAGARVGRHRLRRLLRPPPLRARSRHRPGALVVPHRCPHLRFARAAVGAAGRDLGDLHRIGRRLGLRARPGGPPALAL